MQPDELDQTQTTEVAERPDAPPARRTARYSGLSGNEMYCAHLLGYEPGNLLVGNSVFSLGIIGGISSNIRNVIGGEIKPYTSIIAEGRRLSFGRFQKKLQQSDGNGATGVSSELIFHPGNIEFLSVGSTLHRIDGQSNGMAFASSANAQELFCQWDAGYQPIDFVFGNVAYSIGLGKGIGGAIRQLAKGEVRQYSGIFNTTRNLALERIQKEARSLGANSVIGIRTSIVPVGLAGVQEMVMIGTASYNAAIAPYTDAVGGITTSDLTAEETWNVARLGYVPLKLVLGTSVYSLGVVGGILANIKNLVRGEISELTHMIYGAREQSLRKVQQQAEDIGADDVLGIKTYIYNLGSGLIEFMAIGTAVRHAQGVMPRSDQLPPQAIIRDKDTFVDTANVSYGTDLQRPIR